MDIEKAYRDYFSVVYRYALSLSRDPAVAEELTQETFFKALRQLDSFRGDCSLRTWLCQIAKHSYFDLLRRQAKVGELPEDYEASTTGPEDEAVAREARRSLQKRLHALREPYKEVFTLRTYGELSFSEIAELFGKTESWARVTYHRARMMLKEGLEHE